MKPEKGGLASREGGAVKLHRYQTRNDEIKKLLLYSTAKAERGKSLPGQREQASRIGFAFGIASNPTGTAKHVMVTPDTSGDRGLDHPRLHQASAQV